jgi:prevent-host-death family protein
MTSLKQGYTVKNWPVQDAKARFSEFLRATLTQGPQLVTMRGTEAAVMVPVEEWRRLNARARPGFKALLMASDRRGELTLPTRGKSRRRAAQPRF